MKYNIEDIFTSDFLNSLDDFKITNLPNELNPDKLLDGAMRKKYAYTCPYCGNKYESQKSYKNNIYISTYGEFRKLNNKWWYFWEPMHWCQKLKMKCYNCGLEWESPWYPQDINEQCLKDS